MIQNIFDAYTKSITAKFSHKETSEMGYRTDFEILLKEIFSKINVKRIDHDAKAKEGNKPDYIILKYDIPILYIEAKDIGIDLNKVEKSEQMTRYFGYSNLILTDYVEFRFYRNGVTYNEPIKIADYDIKKRKIIPIPENFETAVKTITDFAQSHKEPIRSGKHLSQIMGGKAQRIRDNIKHFLSNESEKNRSILKVYEVIKNQLVHDLTPDAFADMYAQTLVYGLFVARYHDESPDDFSRQEARDLVPASNPLLRHFFDHIVGADFDKRLEYIVNELCEVFQHADVQKLMQEYYKKDLWGDTYESPDPVIHFYEDFLKEYDPQLRKKLGAYYTPLPVVRFIVRAVDKILERDFGLSSGLADTSKTEEGIHRVQILDPATGTGTFISTVIATIHKRLIDGGQKGRWTTYVHHDLLPRIHGFELMMAPYTIAHLKLSMAFKETGFKYFNRRLGIYLTNSLEESENKENLFGSLGFAGSIAEESKEASKIKNETPIMVVIGNPPYSVSSSNKGEWIQNLIKDYKTGLNERNIQPLSDDYIKFIRFAEYFIEKNKTGIVAMITNNSFIDGIIHRQMRKHLLETYDDIYILDLHGNSKKKEKAPDGSKDENVFDIMQGVSINIFVKKEKENKKFANVFHNELFGLRNEKFKSLNSLEFNKIKWHKLNYIEPNYFFVPKDFGAKDEYSNGIKITELFNKYAAGVATAKDDLIIKFSIEEVQKFVSDFNKYNENEIAHKYKAKLSKVCKVKNDLNNIVDEHTSIMYRPFDTRYTLYSPNSEGVFQRPRSEIMKHLLKDNMAILTCKQQTSFSFQHIFISKSITDRCCVSLQTGEVGYVFPLYLYSDSGLKVPNLNPNILEKIENILGQVTPEEILDYIYAVLHSPDFRKKYKEFLKIDFPRIPYPKDKKSFQELAKFGTELRLLHLLESPKVNQFITTYPVEGTDVVEKLNYIQNKVYINQIQYFGNVPEIAWNFYIGGYQPAQKWLKDRKGRTLTNEDIEHYQKIIVSLSETHRIMKLLNNKF